MKIPIKVVIERASALYFYEITVFNVSSIIVNDSAVPDGAGQEGGDGAGVVNFAARVVVDGAAGEVGDEADGEVGDLA